MMSVQEAAIAALPPGPQRELEVATWARRVAAGPRWIAFVVDPGMSDAEVQALGELARRVRVELAGGGR